MGLLKTIWYLLTGVDRDVKRISRKFDSVDMQLCTISTQLNAIELDLKKIQAELETPLAVSLEINLSGVKLGENQMLEVGTNGSVVATLVALDAAGNPGAKLAETPVWSVSDTELASVAASPDGLTAVVTTNGKLGKFVVSAKSGELSDDSDEIEVVVGAAAVLRVDLGV